MKTNIKGFCERYNITEAQFTGKENIGGGLDLRSLTSIPEGFNPTVGGYLDLRSLTSIPEGFNPTVGGDLYLRSDLKAKVKVNKPKAGVIEDLRRNKLLFWSDGKYVKADGMFTEVLSKKGNVYKVKKLHSVKEFYLVTNGKVHAHGETIEKAKADFRFKLLSERLKKEPIKKDTLISIAHYRLITGACEIGVKSWMQQNNIKTENIRAEDLLPILKKTNAYGFEKFKSLITF